MIPQPRSRLLFAGAALAALTAPFVPDLLRTGAPPLSWVRMGGAAALPAALLFAAAALSGAWNAPREQPGVCVAAIGTALLSAWVVIGIDVHAFAAARPATAVSGAFALGGMIGVFWAFLMSRELELTAAWSRGILGLEAVAASLPYWTSADPAAPCVHAFAVAGLLLGLGEIFEGLAARTGGTLIR